MKSKYKTNIQELVLKMGRDIIIYSKPEKFNCPNCFYDDIAKKSSGRGRWTLAEATSLQADWENSSPDNKGVLRYRYFTNQRCPVCLGIGFLAPVERKSYIKCNIRWGTKNSSDNKAVITVGGETYLNLVTIKTLPKYKNLLAEAESIIIDGLKCTKITPPNIRGLGNSSILVMDLYTTDVTTNSHSAIEDKPRPVAKTNLYG